MRKIVYLVLLAGLLTGEGVLALGLRQPQATVTQGCSTTEIDARTLTSNTFSLTNGTILQISPSAREPLYKHIVNSTRRKLGDFRECSPCTCCDSTRRWCLSTVCCYHINCGIRDLPFGLCSFTPISCSCLGCRE
ncbi:hypothetical protein M758_3G016100 [Ceratodon purpureus]|nr:hypothetical protein M758_3G016100 [Ceratodon purpureus]